MGFALHRAPGPVWAVSLALTGALAPRVAMAAMRHSSLELTMNVYTDPALLDVAGAVEALPALGPAHRHAQVTCAS